MSWWARWWWRWCRRCGAREGATLGSGAAPWLRPRRLQRRRNERMRPVKTEVGEGKTRDGGGGRDEGNRGPWGSSLSRMVRSRMRTGVKAQRHGMEPLPLGLESRNSLLFLSMIRSTSFSVRSCWSRGPGQRGVVGASGPVWEGGGGGGGGGAGRGGSRGERTPLPSKDREGGEEAPSPRASFCEGSQLLQDS